MEAVISGQVGVALLVDGQRLSSIHVSAPGVAVPRRASEFHYLFGTADDLIFLEDVGLEDAARRQLTAASDGQDILQLVLMLLDPERPRDIRQAAAAELAEVLASNPSAAEYAERLLLAEPFPPTADVEGAKNLCSQGPARQWVERLWRLQPAVGKAVKAWRSIPEMAFSAEGDGSRNVADAVLVREGVCGMLALAAAGQMGVGAVSFHALRIAAVKSLPNHRQILQFWTRELDANSKTVRKEQSPEREFWDEQEAPVHGRKGRRRGMDRKKELERVERVKTVIVEAMKARRFDRVKRYVNTLVREQVARSGEQYACKSLCSLAVHAQELGFRALQLESTECAVTVSPEDGWAWCQHGKALLDNARLRPALAAFEQAIVFGETTVGGHGRAEVLRSMGRHREALKAYGAAIASDPEDAVAKNGRAETLRSMGRHQEALDAYDAAIAAHPEDVVVKTGRAETLRSMGRFQEALEAYDAGIAVHAENAVAENGRAETLRSMGRHQDALEAYNAAVAAHPEDMFAKNGRAETLRSMGRFQEALEAYDAAVTSHPENTVSKTGRAETLRSMGRNQEALEAYDAVVEAHPEHAVAKNGRAETLRSLGRHQEALEAYDAAVAAHPENAVAKTGRAETLRSMGRHQEALHAYDAVVAVHPEIAFAKNGRAETLRSMGRHQEALEAYDAAVAAHPENAVAKTGRAETLRSMGRHQEALEAYDAVVEVHPEHAVAKNGRAETLRSIGRHQEALQAYDAIVAVHPENAVAKNGRAETLRSMGRHQEALQAYDAAIAQHPEDSVVRNGRGLRPRPVRPFRGSIIRARRATAHEFSRLGCSSHQGYDALQARPDRRCRGLVPLRVAGVSVARSAEVLRFRAGGRGNERGQLDAARQSLAAIDVAAGFASDHPHTSTRGRALGERDEAEQIQRRLPEQLPREQDELRDELERRDPQMSPGRRKRRTIGRSTARSSVF